MDIEFDFKGSPLGGVITNCMCPPPRASPTLSHLPTLSPFGHLLLQAESPLDGRKLPNLWEPLGPRVESKGCVVLSPGLSGGCFLTLSQICWRNPE